MSKTAKFPRIFTIPGLNSSGVNHWQTRWEDQLDNCVRVELGDWDDPDPLSWTSRIDRAIARAAEPLIVVAHSLGCHAFTNWYSQAEPSRRGRVAAALLVAPPDLHRDALDQRLARFTPVHRVSFGPNGILVGSDNDPYCAPDVAERLARRWGVRYVNAGPFGHINAESRVGDWPYGLYLLASLIDGALLPADQGARPRQEPQRANHLWRHRSKPADNLGAY